ncbi:TetR/AcrR family transcriptional regulator [Thalassorhabdus alkalitolerans]|uniref:TetR/AcrR family transcriptional regulator n=1 Tax=Thalassorhabdus alkalitolerans TaxID=2282697 RepID=A0ABW0YQX6_9BACI
MSAQKIKEAALRSFAQYGFEGASLAVIADETGLKKQSIYAHFEGKDDLFLQTLKSAAEKELQKLEVFLQSHFEEPLHDFLYKVLLNYIDRYRNDCNMKFWLRVSFFPPSHLHHTVIDYVNKHIAKVDLLFFDRFLKAVETNEVRYQDIESMTMAFSALIDSICVELVYGSKERTEKKLEASWRIYWNGIADNFS